MWSISSCTILILNILVIKFQIKILIKKIHIRLNESRKFKYQCSIFEVKSAIFICLLLKDYIIDTSIWKL